MRTIQPLELSGGLCAPLPGGTVTSDKHPPLGEQLRKLRKKKGKAPGFYGEDQLEMSANADHSDSAMIAWRPSETEAKRLSLPGGEDADQLHCTLIFLGDVDDLDTGKASKITEAVASRFSPFTAHVSGYAIFQGDDERCLVALLDSPDLEQLQQRLHDELAAEDIEFPDNHGYTAHVTLKYLTDDDAVDPDWFDRPTFDVQVDSIETNFGTEQTTYDLATDIHLAEFAGFDESESRDKDGRWIGNGNGNVPLKDWAATHPHGTVYRAMTREELSQPVIGARHGELWVRQTADRSYLDPGEVLAAIRTEKGDVIGSGGPGDVKLKPLPNDRVIDTWDPKGVTQDLTPVGVVSALEVELGDLPGHTFHGNQHVKVGSESDHHLRDMMTSVPKYADALTTPGMAAIQLWAKEIGPEAVQYARLAREWSDTSSSAIQQEAIKGSTDRGRELAKLLDNAPVINDTLYHAGSAVSGNLPDTISLWPSSFSRGGVDTEFLLNAHNPVVIEVQGARGVPIDGLSVHPEEREVISGGTFKVLSQEPVTGDYYGKEVPYRRVVVQQLDTALKAAASVDSWWRSTVPLTEEEKELSTTFGEDRLIESALPDGMTAAGYDPGEERDKSGEWTKGGSGSDDHVGELTKHGMIVSNGKAVKPGDKVTYDLHSALTHAKIAVGEGKVKKITDHGVAVKMQNGEINVFSPNDVAKGHLPNFGSDHHGTCDHLVDHGKNLQNDADIFASVGIVAAVQSLDFGDKPGHEFHGNQYTGGRGGEKSSIAFPGIERINAAIKQITLLGIPTENLGLMRPDQIEQVASTLERFHKDFPNVSNRITRVGMAEVGGQAYATTYFGHDGTSQIILNARYFDHLNDGPWEYAQHLETTHPDWHLFDSTPANIMEHELGHVVDHYLGDTPAWSVNEAGEKVTAGLGDYAKQGRTTETFAEAWAQERVGVDHLSDGMRDIYNAAVAGASKPYQAKSSVQASALPIGTCAGYIPDDDDQQEFGDVSGHPFHGNQYTGGLGSGTKEDPIRTSDVTEAARLISEGKFVELPPKSVSILLDKLAEYARQAKAAGEKAPNYDLCKISVPDSNLFCVDSKGIPRIEMPQLSGAPLPGSPASKLPLNQYGEADITSALRAQLHVDGYNFRDETVPASQLKATQNELNGAKVAGIMQTLEAGKLPPGRVFVTSDNYVIDGHHRWAAQVGEDFNDQHLGDVSMDVTRINAPISEMLDYTKSFAAKMGIPQQGVAQGPVVVSALEFVFSPEEERDARGRWTNGAVNLVDRLTKESPGMIKDLFSEDARDAIAYDLSLNNAPTVAQIEKAKVYVQERSQLALRKAGQPEMMTVYRGGHVRSELGFEYTSVSLDKDTARDFARRRNESLDTYQLPISKVQAYIPEFTNLFQENEIFTKTADLGPRVSSQHFTSHPLEFTFDPEEARNEKGEWTSTGGEPRLAPIERGQVTNVRPGAALPFMTTTMAVLPKELQERVMDTVRNHVADPKVIDENLRHFIDVAVQDPATFQAGMNWYQEQHDLVESLSKETDIPAQNLAAALATMSPGTDWTTEEPILKFMAENVGGDVNLSPEDLKAVNDKLDGFAVMDYAKEVAADAKADPSAMRDEFPTADDLHAAWRDQFPTVDDPKAWNRPDNTLYGEIVAERDYENGLVDPADHLVGGEHYNSLDPQTAVIAMQSQFMEQPTPAEGGTRTTGWGVGYGWGGFAKGLSLMTPTNGEYPNVDDNVPGVKVRSFTNNIMDPTDPRDVTIDIHMVQAIAANPKVLNDSSVMGTPAYETAHIGAYPFLADEVRRAALDYGVLPQQAQALAWLGYKREYP